MPAMNADPTPEAFAALVIEFLFSNPDEELTADDACAKFGYPSAKVHSALQPAVRSGQLAFVKNAEEDMVYRKGKRKRAWSGPVDLSSIKLEDDVALPTANRGASKTDWSALLNRMQPGQSCVLPRRARGTVTRLATAFKKEGKGEFAIRVLDEQQMRFWRVK